MRNRLPAAATGLALLLTAACRQDMHNQPRYKPLAESEFFNDHRSARPQVEDTVARGHLRTDLARYTGKIGNTEINYFPIPITKADVVRGQQRFNIYCSPCHSRIGDGQGMIVMRGFRQPPSYHIDRLKNEPVGHFFDVMTNGFGAMASYASRVAPDDRWRIIAYIRALQLSESRGINDVPTDQRGSLAANAMVQAGQPNPGQITNGPPANPAQNFPDVVPQSNSNPTNTQPGQAPTTQPGTLPANAPTAQPPGQSGSPQQGQSGAARP